MSPRYVRVHQSLIRELSSARVTDNFETRRLCEVKSGQQRAGWGCTTHKQHHLRHLTLGSSC